MGISNQTDAIIGWVRMSYLKRQGEDKGRYR